MKNENKPAFPVSKKDFDDPSYLIKIEDINGLTKREYFAGLAMQALVPQEGYLDNEFGVTAKFNVVKQAIGFADELLKQLETK